jgi:hypothetical protein
MRDLTETVVEVVLVVSASFIFGYIVSMILTYLLFLGL